MSNIFEKTENFNPIEYFNIPEDFQPMYTSDKFIYLLTGGRGGAKSFNVALYIMLSSFKKFHNILYTRYTMSNTETSIMKEFMEKIEMFDMSEYFDIKGNTIRNTMTDSMIYFDGIKTSSGNQTAKLKGFKGLTMAIVDEAEEWQSEEEFDKLLGSIRNPKMEDKYFKFIIVMNPSTPEHFIYQNYIKWHRKIIQIDGFDVEISTKPNVLHIHTTYHKYEKYLPKPVVDEIKNYKKLYERGIDLFKYPHQFIGQWLHNVGGIMFTTINYYDILPEIGFNYCFIDPADEGDDYLCAWFIRMGEDRRLYAHDCIYTKENSNFTLPLIAKKCRKHNVTKVIVEINGLGAGFLKSLQRQYKINNIRGFKSDNLSKNQRMRSYNHLIGWINFKQVKEEEQFMNDNDMYVMALNDLRKTPYVFNKSSSKKMDLDSADCISIILKYFYEKFPSYFKDYYLLSNANYE